MSSDAAGGNGDDIPPPPVERAPGEGPCCEPARRGACCTAARSIGRSAATGRRAPRAMARAVSATRAAGDGRAPAAAAAATALLEQLEGGMPALGGGEGEGMEVGGVWRRKRGGLRGGIE